MTAAKGKNFAVYGNSNFILDEFLTKALTNERDWFPEFFVCVCVWEERIKRQIFGFET